MRQRSSAAARLALLLAVLLVGACATVDPRVAEAVAPVSEETLREHVETQVGFGPRHWSQPAAQAETRAWLHAELTGLGWETRDEVFEAAVRIGDPIRATREDGEEVITGFEYSYPVREHVNVIAEQRGLGRPDHVVELLAHYDTVARSPGADDNASGVAGLLEVARVLAALPLRDTVRLVFTAMEEDGLHGARAHVELLQAEIGDDEDRFRGALVLDPIGYTDHRPDSQGTPIRVWLLADPPTTGDFVLLVGNWSSGSLGDDVESALERYSPELPRYGFKRLGGFVSDAARSDHKPYWDAGLPAVWLNDFADPRSPHYHQPSDTPDTLDYVFMAQVTRGAAAWAVERAGWADGARGDDVTD